MGPTPLTPLEQLGIALALGMLVGLQREWAHSGLGGIRTFPLITVLGTVAALLASAFGGWVVAAGFVALAVVIALGSIPRWREGGQGSGVTTEVAALVMFGIGALVGSGHAVPALALGGGVAVLLHSKQPLHNLVRALGEEDTKAIMRFVLVALVILPALPDEPYGPFGVLNPFRIWLMVALIVGISLAAYVVSKLLGSKVGTLAEGVLGGLISSTATTVSAAREARAAAAHCPVASVVVILASAVVLFRVLLEIAVVAPDVLPTLAPPLEAMAAWMSAIACGSYLIARRQLAVPIERQAPTSLTGAIVFGLLYAAVLFGISLAKRHFGDAGIYAVAAISGLTDVDAITLSTAQMAHGQQLDAHTGWRVILVGALANLVFKAGVVLAMGSRELARRTLPAFGLMLAGGAAILVLWP